jgi:glycosyltransferase involved in cell wall biosynthesis
MQEIYDNNLDNIKVINSVPSSDLMILLNQATIAIAPNLRIRKQEIAIPTKLFEYMAASLPIVSSDLPYQKELITRHKIGLLAQPEDPDSFVEAIDKLYKDKHLAAKLGRNGRIAFEENYTWESRLPFLIDFYEKILV